MIEPEMAFYDIDDNMQLAEDFVKYCIQYALSTTAATTSTSSPSTSTKVPVERPSSCSTTTSSASPTPKAGNPQSIGPQVPVPGGMGHLTSRSEHERYLVEEHFAPGDSHRLSTAHIKAFYMKQNDDGRTVRAMDVLFPQHRRNHRWQRARGRLRQAARTHRRAPHSSMKEHSNT